MIAALFSNCVQSFLFGRDNKSFIIQKCPHVLGTTAMQRCLCGSCGSFNITVLVCALCFCFVLFFVFCFFTRQLKFHQSSSVSVQLYLWIPLRQHREHALSLTMLTVIKVQYCCYCHGELNSKFKNISVQLCICMLSWGLLHELLQIFPAGHGSKLPNQQLS